MFRCSEKYSEMRKLLRKGNNCDPYERKDFYKLKIDLLDLKKKEYEFWPEEKAAIEIKRIGAIKGLADALDEIRDTYRDY